LIDPHELLGIPLEGMNAFRTDTGFPRFGKHLDQLDGNLHLATPTAFDRGDSAAVRTFAERAKGFGRGKGHFRFSLSKPRANLSP
jgi:hypothetical protein